MQFSCIEQSEQDREALVLGNGMKMYDVFARVRGEKSKEREEMNTSCVGATASDRDGSKGNAGEEEKGSKSRSKKP